MLLADIISMDVSGSLNFESYKVLELIACIIYTLEHWRDWWASYRQCLWASLHFRHWCIAIYQIFIGVVLRHKLSCIEPIVKLVEYISLGHRIKCATRSARGRWREETIRRYENSPSDFLERAIIYSQRYIRVFPNRFFHIPCLHPNLTRSPGLSDTGFQTALHQSRAPQKQHEQHPVRFQASPS